MFMNKFDCYAAVDNTLDIPAMTFDAVWDLINALPSIDEGWISVEDSLPTDRFWKRVLVNNKNHIQPHNFEDGRWYEYGCAWPTDMNVTHWQDFQDYPNHPLH